MPSSSSSLTLVWAFAAVLQQAAGQVLFHAQQFGGGLGDIDVHGVELLDGGQRRGLAGGDQRAGGDRGAADAAGNRRLDAGVIEVDARGLQGRPGGRDLGLGLLERRLGIIIILLADRIDFYQLPIPFGLEPDRREIGFGPGQGRPWRLASAAR